MEYVTRGVCGQEGCPETRYSLDNGLWFCLRGHQQEGRQVEEDPEDFGTQGKTNRLKKAPVEKIQKTYRGRRAFSLFLQAYQLILWKQCYALVQKKSFPPELETTVRDLWALRLKRLSERIDDSSDDEIDAQIFSSQVAGTSEDEVQPQTRGRKVTDAPRLVDSLGLCYLGALLLRLPVGIGDLHRFAMQQEVPFIRAIREVPRAMRDRLPQEYLSALDTRTLLKPEHLHRTVLELVLLYSKEFGISFPPLNSPLILFGYIKQLALPLEIYPTVNQLQKLVAYTYEYPVALRERATHLLLPEVQMIALVVVATKLLFPFDDVERYPESVKEPTAQLMDWNVWAQAQREFEKRSTAGGRIGKGNEILLDEKDIFNMPPHQLDEYMDWYEKSWMDSKVSHPLSDIFPTGRTGIEDQPDPVAPVDDEEALKIKLKTVMSVVRPRKAVSDEEIAGREDEILRPGALYQRYRTESDLPDIAKPFFEAAAKTAGVSLKTLVRVVFQTELRIDQWLDDLRRMEYHGEHPEAEARAAGSMSFEGDASMDEMEYLDEQAFSDPEDRL